jgi:hypothetical protein
MVLIERACKPLNFLGGASVGGRGALSIWIRRIIAAQAMPKIDVIQT